MWRWLILACSPYSASVTIRTVFSLISCVPTGFVSGSGCHNYCCHDYYFNKISVCMISFLFHWNNSTNLFCKFTFIHKNFIFAEIQEFVHEFTALSRDLSFLPNICIHSIYVRKSHILPILVSANTLTVTKPHLVITMLLYAKCLGH